MAELSAKEKLYAKNWGWKDNGDGTLTTTNGRIYDHEAGSNYSERTAFLPNGERMDTSNFIDVPTTRAQVNEDGVAEYTVIYSDGTESYAGTGEEGKNEAMRARQRALSYNRFIGDTRTRSDFATDEEYRNHTILRDIRIGQGTYNYIREKNGNTKLLGPNGIVLQEGSDFNAIRKNMYDKSNKYYMAKNILGKTDEPISQHLISYIKNRDGVTEQEAYQSIYKQYARRYETMGKIYSEWQQAAQEQGIELPEQYSVEVPTFDQFMSRMTFVDDPMSYSEWYKINVRGQKPAVTTGVTGTDTGVTGTTTTGTTTGTTETETPTVTQPTTPEQPVTEQPTAPTTATFTPQPQPYTIGTGTYMPTFGMDTTKQPLGTATTGTFTKGTYGMYDSATGGVQQPQIVQPTVQTPTIQTPQPQNIEVKTFRNPSGLTANVTYVNGQPQTPIPSGFAPVDNTVAPQQMPAPATAAPIPTAASASMPMQMAYGGMVDPNQGPIPMTDQQMYQLYNQPPQGYAPGGDVTNPTTEEEESTTVDLGTTPPKALDQQYIPQQDFTGADTLTDVQTKLAKDPGLPEGATVVPVGTQVTKEQLVSPYSGQVTGDAAVGTQLATTEQAYMPVQTETTKVTPVESAAGVQAETDKLEAATGTVSDEAQVEAAQQTESSVSSLEAAQGEAYLIDNPVQRELQDGELIDTGAIAGQAQKAAKFTEQIEAATATPSEKATVQGQLNNLMDDFEGGATPAWAAGAMRAATAKLAARGLGASSMAGQAVIQAAMESALPIAQADAATQASFEAQNLSNRQQRAMLAAQQRAQFMGQEFDQAFQARVANASKISDIANMNFTAEQQVQLENARATNTMNMANLNNRQAMVMAEAAALANLDMANLSNRQAAAVQNAQSFLQMDMANLSNEQQTSLFKSQQRIQSLFTDQAAINAAQQFNATSQNQTDQFFASLANNTAQFNAAQANAQAQFNAGQVNVIERFNAEINNQRDQFNAQNRLVIDQSNAQWRREIATAGTAAVNRANELNASALLGYSQTAYNNLWQFYSDNMEWAWTSAENERGRIANLAIAQLQADKAYDLKKLEGDFQSSAGFGEFIGKLFTSDLTKTIGGSILGDVFKIG